jgi:histidine triad (HIT) family protein
MSEPTVFTRIINRELPANIVYEDKVFIAFHDIHPKAPVHVLLVTKEPYETLEDISIENAELHGQLLVTARKVAHQLGIQENYKLFMNVGKDVQEVYHVHMHIMGGWTDQKSAAAPEL